MYTFIYDFGFPIYLEPKPRTILRLSSKSVNKLSAMAAYNELINMYWSLTPQGYEYWRDVCTNLGQIINQKDN